MKCWVAFVSLLAASPCWAVGLGPLVKQGTTDGPDKGFYLTLYNPYREHAAFTVYAIDKDDDAASPRIRVPVSPLPLAGQTTRKFLIIATGLSPGEIFTFRVCAERIQEKEEMIHARVCSRLTARRIAVHVEPDIGGDR